MNRFKLFGLSILLVIPGWSGAQASDPVLATMQQELNRSLQNLKRAPTPPYFLSYQLTDNRSTQVTASSGALTGSLEQNTRLLDLDLRVGDYSLDNTHVLRDAERSSDFSDRFDRQKIPLDDDPDALRVALWQETERKYRSAVQRLQQVKANVQVKVEAEDHSGDFSHEAPETHHEPIATFSVNRADWENKVRNYTTPFASHKEIIEDSAQVIAEVETRRYVNSDEAASLFRRHSIASLFQQRQKQRMAWNCLCSRPTCPSALRICPATPQSSKT